MQSSNSSHQRAAATADEAWLVYDGGCPFCSRYVRYLRLRESVGRLHLINARDGGPAVDEVLRAGHDLDEGMVLKIGDRFYHGADCIHALALLSGGSSAFNRLNALIFRAPRAARLLYPVLRSGRNLALWGLGRQKLKLADSGGPSPG